MAFKEEEERDLPSFNQRIVMGGSPLMTEHRILARDPSSRNFEKEKGSITGGDEEGDEESTRWGSIHNKITGIIILDLRRNEGIQLRANRQTITKDRQRKTDTERQWRWDTKGWHWQEKCQEEKREKLSEKKERTRHRLYSLFQERDEDEEDRDEEKRSQRWWQQKETPFSSMDAMPLNPKSLMLLLLNHEKKVEEGKGVRRRHELQDTQTHATDSKEKESEKGGIYWKRSAERIRWMKEEESMSWETRCKTELLLETLTANNVRE